MRRFKRCSKGKETSEMEKSYMNTNQRIIVRVQADRRSILTVTALLFGFVGTCFGTVPLTLAQFQDCIGLNTGGLGRRLRSAIRNIFHHFNARGIAERQYHRRGCMALPHTAEGSWIYRTDDANDARNHFYNLLAPDFRRQP